MAPAQSIQTLPHANAQPTNVYNVPRAPEVFTLQESLDAAIPEDIHKQFDRDENGRILFFTAPPLKRPENGVADAYTRLGHGVEYAARAKEIQELRRQRALKRKERDEAVALEAANKKKSPSPDGGVKSEKEELTQEQLLEKFILEWATQMDQGTELLKQELGEGWEEMKKQVREEHKGLSEKQIRDRSLEWFLDDLEKRGEISADEKRKRKEFWESQKAENRG